jgi:hypothetical protein
MMVLLDLQPLRGESLELEEEVHKARNDAQYRRKNSCIRTPRYMNGFTSL